MQVTTKDIVIAALTFCICSFAFAADEATSSAIEAAKTIKSFPLSNSDFKLFDKVTIGSTSIDQLSVIEVKRYGTLDNAFVDTGKNDIPLIFGSVYLDTHTFNAVFYENILIALTLKSDEAIGLDKQFVKDLRQSFDAKYKRLPKVTRTEKSDSFTYTYTVERWSGPLDAFVVQIQDKRKFTVSLSGCKAYINLLRQAGIGTANEEYECNKATDNLLIYGLSYRYIPGLDAANKAIKREQEARTLKEKTNAAARTSKF